MKKIGLIAMALVLALGTLGVGFAFWTETLEVTADVETGELKVCFVDAWCEPDPFGAFTMEVNLLDPDGDGNKNIAEIIVLNAQQCSQAKAWITIKNQGTIPVHINLSVTSKDPHLDVDISNDPTCQILQPGDEWTFDVHVHGKISGPYDVEELAEYKFQLQLVGEQFNAGPQWGPPGGATSNLLVNGGFDLGDFTGWTCVVPVGGQSVVVSSHTGDQGMVYLPIDDGYFARVKTNGPGTYATVSQSFAMYKDMKLKGWAFFDYRDYHPYNDTAMVQIKDAAGTVIATPWSVQGLSVPNYADCPWTHWEWQAPADGTYTVVLKIANALDSVLDSYAGFDAHAMW
jgi:hypothetical protein